MRRIILALAAITALVWALPAAAQKSSKKSAKAEKQSQKEASQDKDEGASAAPDKVLYDRAMKDIKKGRHEVARLTLQTLINTYPDSEYLAKSKMAMADSYYKEGGSGNLTQAIAAYKDFIVFFPFLPEASYAQMQVAMTHYREMAKPDRDRTEALAAEDEFQTFLVHYPNDPLVTKAQQRLREVQEILAEGDFRVGYYYYVKGDKRAAAGRLIAVTNRYPLYSQSDRALWMLGDIFEKSEKKEVASIYYAKIVREYPLSPLVPDAKQKLVAFAVPVPQPDPKALAWMQAEASAPRPHPGFISKPLALINTKPHQETIDAARTGQPNMTSQSEGSSSDVDVLSGGNTSRIGAGGPTSSAPGNTAVVEVATPGSNATNGSNTTGNNSTEAPATNSTPPAANNSEPGSGAQGGSDVPADPPPPAASGTPDPNANANGANGTAQPANANGSETQKADKKTESTSKKKKGIKKIIPW